jgi:hypothetical protein
VVGIVVMVWRYRGYVMGVSWLCFGGIVVMVWGYRGYGLGDDAVM